MGKLYTVERGERTSALDSAIVEDADARFHYIFDVHQGLGTNGSDVEEYGLDARLDRR